MLNKKLKAIHFQSLSCNWKQFVILPVNFNLIISENWINQESFNAEFPELVKLY